MLGRDATRKGKAFRCGRRSRNALFIVGEEYRLFANDSSGFVLLSRPAEGSFCGVRHRVKMIEPTSFKREIDAAR